MPRLTDDKRESIGRTYQTNHSYSKTAEIEGVDPRTVRDVVKKRNTELVADVQTNSLVSRRRKYSIDTSLTPVQLNAFKEFQKGQPIEQVCLKLRLEPRIAIKYRRLFDEMKIANLDVMLAKKTGEKRELDEAFEQRQKEHVKLYEENESLTAKVKENEARIQELIKERNRLEPSIQSLRESERISRHTAQEMERTCQVIEEKLKKKTEPDVVGLLGQLEALPESDLYAAMRPVFKSNLFKKIAPVFLHIVFRAIIHQPYRVNIVAALKSLPPGYNGEDMKLACEALFDREEFNGLLEYLEEHGPADADYWLAIMANRSVSPNLKVKYGTLKMLRTGIGQ